MIFKFIIMLKILMELQGIVVIKFVLKLLMIQLNSKLDYALYQELEDGPLDLIGLLTIMNQKDMP